ncbi:hypothetical protein TSAR_002721 [Trichomalopsis sarcophagae]|uniref:Uncharacterized protein n=1 Tax=Trichomalopsis sarcophagae TaxID=543379 RepID=A0A232F3V7_9HYME|nr:hypothetical protein TSAR_002721 [Trichomalopsis sarcophagae]
MENYFPGWSPGSEMTSYLYKSFGESFYLHKCNGCEILLTQLSTASTSSPRQDISTTHNTIGLGLDGNLKAVTKIERNDCRGSTTVQLVENEAKEYCFAVLCRDCVSTPWNYGNRFVEVEVHCYTDDDFTTDYSLLL